MFGGSHLEWFCRGGPKHYNAKEHSCEGVSYHANIYEQKRHKGDVKFEKELEHLDDVKGYYQGKKNITKLSV